VDIIKRSINLFDKIIVGIGKTRAKAPCFQQNKRMKWINEISKDEPKVEGTIYDGLYHQLLQ
jgi:pantetheine-phosphate adenylyltransferase